ncbi:hypothetical protein AAV28_32555 [Bradyrhizobium diazoefficiens USDA 110]|nr:hypothetical protein AAV28_32555 [Bradyrhizobium diazoefficiens USDA 110]
MRDFARGSTLDVFLEDALNNLCLGLDDNALTRSSGDRGISVCQAASSQALFDPPGQTATHLMCVIFAIELSDQAAKADQHSVDDAFMDCPDLDPEKG